MGLIDWWRIAFDSIRNPHCPSRQPPTQAKRWIERVALPVTRSDCPDLQPACDFIGLNAIGALMALCRGQADVQALVEEATLLLLEDVAATRGEEESARVLAARIR